MRREPMKAWCRGLAIGLLLGAGTVRADVSAPGSIYISVPAAPNIFVTVDQTRTSHLEHALQFATPLSGSPQTDFLYPPVDGMEGLDVPALIAARRAVAPAVAVGSRFINTSRSANTCTLRSPDINRVYYNPEVRYRPWLKADGRERWPDADPEHAWYDPLRPGLGGIDLTREQVRGADFDADTVFLEDYLAGAKRVFSYHPAVYFRFREDWLFPGYPEEWLAVYQAIGCSTTLRLYERVEISPGRTFPKAPARSDCTTLEDACTYDEEIRNFANWFSYYRSRSLALRGAIGEAMAALGENVRVGMGGMSNLARYTPSCGIDERCDADGDGVEDSGWARGVRPFSSDDREAVFDMLYEGLEPDPLAPTRYRAATEAVGRYFDRDDDAGPWGDEPGASEGSNYACRRSFHVLTSAGGPHEGLPLDKCWNRADNEVPSGSTETCGEIRARYPGNLDNEPGPVVTGPNGESYQYRPEGPFRDDWPYQLSDVALSYWYRDLNDRLDNILAPVDGNPAFWQHLSTYVVLFGPKGVIDPPDAFAALREQRDIPWPALADPGSAGVAGDDIVFPDDLLHAAINGRGGFFYEGRPDALSESLRRVFDEIMAIASRVGAGGSVAASSTAVSADTRVFQAEFSSGGWVGDLKAYPVSASGVGETPIWSASDKLPDHDDREIYTFSGGEMVPFEFDSLSRSDQALFDDDPDLVAYLRGDQSKELRNGGDFRNRPDGQVIGDIMHSSPVYVKDDEMVYVGANDGMLHAFDARTGVERFAYVPSAVLSRMKELGGAEYGQASHAHYYFVDGKLAVSDDRTTPGKKYLVALLGRGGTGLFALDVTAPQGFGTNRLLWEYFPDNDDDLGYMLGEPVIVKMNDGKAWVVVGNGYRSASGDAVLYLIRLDTGAVHKIPTHTGTGNGLGSPGVFDADGDGDIDWIYAGDLKGNLWKFDVRGSSAADWKVAFGSSSDPEPLFRALDPSGNPQPITQAIRVAVKTLVGQPNYGKRFVFFGTGDDFGDFNSSLIHSWYGIIDDGSQIDTRGASGTYPTLVARSVQTEGVTEGYKVRVFEAASNGDMVGKEGWYLDLTTHPGERMVTASSLYTLAEPVLIASSVIPPSDACGAGDGGGFVNAIDPFTGARLSLGFFDLNEDDDFTNDLFENSPVGGVDPGVSMPSRPALVGSRLVVGGSDASTGSLKVNPGVPAYKGRMMWREVVFD